MSTRRAPAIANLRRRYRALGPICTPNPGDPAAASAALAVTVALLRALRDRGLLSEGEIDDIFGEAAERLRDTSALNLLDRVRVEVEYREEE
ncbi:MAG TPA: hypothetical protein VKP67_02800 [Xanthobacteraceae bacterium]|nr:hypothetical protein [Xanthobacteraceae bacterium]